MFDVLKSYAGVLSPNKYASTSSVLPKTYRMQSPSLILLTAFLLLCTIDVVGSSKCKDNDCETKNNEYACGDDRCHRYSFCNPETSRCECPLVSVGEMNTKVGNVCGTDDVVYTSVVVLRRKACLNNTQVEVKTYGICRDTAIDVQDQHKNDDDDEATEVRKSHAIIIPIVIICLIAVVLLTAGWLYHKKKTNNKFTITKRESQKEQFLML